MSNQQKVIDFIKHDRTLTGARNLYNSLPNKSLSFLASINRMRSTDANIKMVCYQLCTAVGLQERQMLALYGNKVEPRREEKKEPKVIVIGGGDRSLAERLLQFKAESTEWRDIQILASDVSDDLEKEANGRNKPALLALIQEGREKVIIEKAASVPLEVRKSIKLRLQFPFLKEKDCPEILKVLVSDMITAYEKYRDGHAQLFESMTKEEEQNLARCVVDNFIENKQAFAELEHYRDSGQILGEHPIFEEQKIREDLEKLSGEELSKKANALRKNISTNRKRAEEAEDPEAKAKYEAVVKDYQWQEEYVKELLKRK